MKLRITDQYQITTDEYQYIVNRKRTRKGKLDWDAESYHPTFQRALQHIGERLVRGSDAQTFADAIADVENVTTSLSQALRPYFEHGLELKADPPIVCLKKGVTKGEPNV